MQKISILMQLDIHLYIELEQSSVRGMTSKSLINDWTRKWESNLLLHERCFFLFLTKKHIFFASNYNKQNGELCKKSIFKKLEEETLPFLELWANMLEGNRTKY